MYNFWWTGPIIINEDETISAEETPSDKLRELMLMNGEDDSPVILPFEGFRERIRAAQKARADDSDSYASAIVEKIKKSLPEADILRPNPDAALDEERLGAHFRKTKTKVPPFTAEYITGNNVSPLDAEVRSNALEKYKQSFAEKNFPFEYENPSNEIPEQRIYFDDLEEMPIDLGSGELDPYILKGNQTVRSLSMQWYWLFMVRIALIWIDIYYFILLP